MRIIRRKRLGQRDHDRGKKDMEAIHSLAYRCNVDEWLFGSGICMDYVLLFEKYCRVAAETKEMAMEKENYGRGGRHAWNAGRRSATWQLAAEAACTVGTARKIRRGFREGRIIA